MDFINEELAALRDRLEQASDDETTNLGDVLARLSELTRVVQSLAAVVGAIHEFTLVIGRKP